MLGHRVGEGAHIGGNRHAVGQGGEADCVGPGTHQLDELEALRVPQVARLQVAVEGPRDQDLRDGQPLTPLLTRCVRQEPDPGVGRQGLGESGPAALAGIVRHQDVRPVVRTPHRGHCARS